LFNYKNTNLYNKKKEGEMKGRREEKEGKKEGGRKSGR
jgi:hypothetical protein